MAEKFNNSSSSDASFVGPLDVSKHTKEVNSNSLHDVEEGSIQFNRIKNQVNETWDAFQRGEGETLTEDELNQRLKY